MVCGCPHCHAFIPASTPSGMCDLCQMECEKHLNRIAQVHLSRTILPREESIDQIDALARMNALCANRRIGFRLEYDVDYGIDLREGWSVTVDGSVVVQFVKTPKEALLAALDRIKDWGCRSEKE